MPGIDRRWLAAGENPVENLRRRNTYAPAGQRRAGLRPDHRTHRRTCSRWFAAIEQGIQRGTKIEITGQQRSRGLRVARGCVVAHNAVAGTLRVARRALPSIVRCRPFWTCLARLTTCETICAVTSVLHGCTSPFF